MIVVKVGGSLYHHPRLGPGLREYLGTLAPSSILIVPGGGEFADAVRKLDVIHGLGEEPAHWLALTSLWAAAAFLRILLPGSECESHPDAARFDSLPLGSIRILDSHMFCQFHASAPDHLPPSWDVTSDSIASRCCTATPIRCSPIGSAISSSTACSQPPGPGLTLRRGCRH